MNIRVYGAAWCSDCVIIKKFLDAKEIHYEYVDITDNNEAKDIVKQINNGKQVIPTLIINQVSYTNPGINELMKIIE